MGGWGGSKAQEFLEWGGRGHLNNFFSFQTGLNFHMVARKVLLFEFCFSSCERKKIINLANLKHKINNFVLVRLDILSPLACDHFPE